MAKHEFVSLHALIVPAMQRRAGFGSDQLKQFQHTAELNNFIISPHNALPLSKLCAGNLKPASEIRPVSHDSVLQKIISLCDS